MAQKSDPLECLTCGGSVYDLKADARLEQSFRGENLIVETPVMVCRTCQTFVLSLGQIDELRRRTADVYRVKHGLLTSSEIRKLRGDRGMNQVEFARFLSVGEASVKRWETWLVQDKSSDQLMRLKCGMKS